jgi:hypothetical protein
MLMKAVIEELRINNGYIDRYEKMTAAVLERDGEAHLKQTLQMHEGRMIFQLERIKKAEAHLKTATVELVQLFEREGIE